ncbi:SDR family NAD(P)-dependent oxidoreductase [Micromonospora sp. NPDC049559]|uniref:SDR family NAD(P)-dependent oxidoreductase n=1 Tax=Micromonospora sp. NPDC049559 TaxID=3155923 RepID=UPI003448EB79
MPQSPPRSLSDVIERATAAAGGVPGTAAVEVCLRPRRDVIPQPSSIAEPVPVASDDLPLADVDGGPFTVPTTAPATLTAALVRAANSATRRGTTYIWADGNEDRQTYRDLLDDAARVLAGLRARGVVPGDSVLLHCDDNRNFVTGFWACLLGGFVPTPIGVAPTYRWANATTRRLHNAWQLLDRAPILTDAALAPQIGDLGGLWGVPRVEIWALEDLRADAPATDLFPADPDHPAVHLLTSGSTGVPKCVRHSHRTVLARAYVNQAVNGFGHDEVTLNFMPLDHVAGMVMHNVRDVVLEYEHVNARTDSFLADPLRWFDWIERHRVTNTSAPNFVITLITQLAEEVKRRRWELSTLRDITNGGEAIVSRTMHRFLRLLAPSGLAPDVMRPTWGMSEVCGGAVHSTMHRDDESVGVITVDARTMAGRLRPLPGPTQGHPTFVEVGTPDPGTRVRIVDDAGSTLPELHVGRLQVRGITGMVAYHGNPAANRAAFTDDGWLDTGDLGFVYRGRLVVTGREKDTVVIRSQNYPCHEIESVVEGVKGVEPTFVAACSEHAPETGTDELILFVVFATDDVDRRAAVVRDIIARLSREIGLRPRRIVPVPRVAFPKTSAGKIERSRLRDEYRSGAYDEVLVTLPALSDDDAKDLGLFVPTWLPLPVELGPPADGPWVVIDHADLAERLSAVVDVPVITVRAGVGFERRSRTDYVVDPADANSYAAALAAVRHQHGAVGAVVHGAVATGPEDLALSVCRLLRACGDGEVPVLVLTWNAAATSDGDTVDPTQAVVTGLVRTANAEYGSKRVRHLDLDPTDQDPVPAVVAELGLRVDDEVVAYRRGVRLVRRIRPLDTATAATGDGFRRGGVYLVTGGLGDIGHRVARHLLTRHRAKVVLVGRSEPTGERARRLVELAATGDVLYHQADVAEAPAVQAAVTAAEARWGRALDGVLHLAGADISRNWRHPEDHLLSNEDPIEFRRLFRAKVAGTRSLARVLHDRPDASLLLFSSLNGHFGGTGFGAYASASAFLPAFAEYWRRQGRKGQCLSWSLWSDTTGSGVRNAALTRLGFRPLAAEQALDLLVSAMAATVPHILIGLDGNNAHIARETDPRVLDDLEVLVRHRGSSDADVAVAVRGALGDGVAVRAERVATDREVRPEGDAEAGTSLADAVVDALVELWRGELRNTSVEPRQSFFELGGNSMTAIRLVGRVNDRFGTRLVVQDLYDCPTAQEMAAVIRSQWGEPSSRSGPR